MPVLTVVWIAGNSDVRSPRGKAQERRAIAAPQASERPEGRTLVNSHWGFVIDEPPWMAQELILAHAVRKGSRVTLHQRVVAYSLPANTASVTEMIAWLV